MIQVRGWGCYEKYFGGYRRDIKERKQTLGLEIRDGEAGENNRSVGWLASTICFVWEVYLISGVLL